MRRLAVVIALGLVAAACGGDDAGTDDGSADATTTTAAATTTAEPGGEGTVAQEGDFVAVHYIGTLDDGTEFDASRPRGSTLDFEIGSGGMITGFDQGVRGMTVGETKTVRFGPEDGYGEANPDLIEDVDISLVPPGTTVGASLIDPQTGRPVRVVEVGDETVTVDRNPELAGQWLTFEIEMVAINP